MSRGIARSPRPRNAPIRGLTVRSCSVATGRPSPPSTSPTTVGPASLTASRRRSRRDRVSGVGDSAKRASMTSSRRSAGSPPGTTGQAAASCNPFSVISTSPRTARHLVDLPLTLEVGRLLQVGDLSMHALLGRRAAECSRDLGARGNDRRVALEKLEDRDQHGPDVLPAEPAGLVAHWLLASRRVTTMPHRPGALFTTSIAANEPSAATTACAARRSCARARALCSSVTPSKTISGCSSARYFAVSPGRPFRLKPDSAESK